MDKLATPNQQSIANWHRNLLVAAAVFSVLLIAMGGVLCVTQNIRSCPDWPGCFGKILPPLQTGPVLEITHRLLAAITGLLILTSAIVGAWRARRLPLILWPPLFAIVLVVEVSVLGALVVLRGISRGWAAIDIGSAFLVVALMVTSATTAFILNKHQTKTIRMTVHHPFTRLVLATAIVVYVILVSGVLVAGNSSITACSGWPVYSPQLISMDLPGVAKFLRLALSVVGIGLILTVFAQASKNRAQQPVVYQMARLIVGVFSLEIVLQILLLVFGFKVYLLIPYTVTASVFWALLVVMVVFTSLQERVSS